MTNTVVRARIDEYVKEEAAAVLATIGLTVSDACRLMMVRIAKDSRDSFYRFKDLYDKAANWRCRSCRVASQS